MKRFWFSKDQSSSWLKDFFTSNLMATQITLLQMNGQWPINFSKYLPKYLSFLSTPLVYMYYTLRWFMALHIAVFFFIAFIIKLNAENSTIPEITQCLIQSTIYVFAFYATIYFQFYHKEMATMISFMTKNFKMRSARGLTYVTTEPSYRMARFFTICWAASCMTGVLHYVLLPISLQIWELPLPCWYPFDYYPHPIFEIVYISQFIGQTVVGLSFVNADTILISMVVLICAQYDILFCSLKNVRYTAMLINSLSKNRTELKKLQDQMHSDDEEVNQYYYSFEQKEDLDDTKDLLQTVKELQLNSQKNQSNGRIKDRFIMEYENELAVALKECIIHHQNIIKICHMLESLYHPIVLVKSFNFTLQLCCLTYVASKGNSSFMQNINYLEYLLLTVFDLLIFGYAGNWMKDQSIRVSDALLRCPWHLCGIQFRRSLLIILANNVKPILLTGGKFFIFDYTKVIAIVKASFSYYTLLQKLG